MDRDQIAAVAAQVVCGQLIDLGGLRQAGQITTGEFRLLDILSAFRGSLPATSATLAPVDVRDAHDLDTGFEIVEEIGRGAVSRVYRARDKGLGRTVALKIISEEAAPSAETRTRFIDEARLLASLDHPNVVRIHGIDDIGGRIRLALEHIDGRTLDRILCDEGPFSFEETARIGIEICRALAALHKRGLVHRDVKPANIMRCRNGRIVLLDFGIARASDAAAEEASLAGTPLTMAPEQFLGQNVTPLTDTFGAGVVLYLLVTGAWPFGGGPFGNLRERVLSGRSTPLCDHRPDAPLMLCRIIEKAIRPDREGRWQSAGELARALQEFLDERAAVRSGAVRVVALEPRCMRILIAAIAASLGLAVAFGLLNALR